MSKLTAYHGGRDVQDARWFTTDRNHAAYFGPVSEVVIDTSNAVHVDADSDERLVSSSCDEAEMAIQEIMDSERATILTISGWEGNGLVILLDEPYGTWNG